MTTINRTAIFQLDTLSVLGLSGKTDNYLCLQEPCPSQGQLRLRVGSTQKERERATSYAHHTCFLWILRSHDIPTHSESQLTYLHVAGFQPVLSHSTARGPGAHELSLGHLTLSYSRTYQ